MIAVIYGSTTGNTENVARKICEYLGEDKAQVISVSEFNLDNLEDYASLLLGASTWGFGDLQDDWEAELDNYRNLDLSGKKVGFFGCGDQEGFADTFVDSMGLIYEAVKNSGADFIGSCPTDGYDFSDSKALLNGKFLGLPIDDDCQANLTEERIKDWVLSLGI